METQSPEFDEGALLRELRADEQRRSTEKMRQHQNQINKFVSYAATKGVALDRNDFIFIPAIGIVAHQKDLLPRLNPGLEIDKEGLISPAMVKSIFVTKSNVPGYFYSEHYMAMLHPYFRRGFSACANYAPRLVEIIWPEFETLAAPSVALDLDRVRVDVSDILYMEFDTWYGAPFSNTINSIPDGAVRLRPPLDIPQNLADFLFHYAYALDLKWSTSPGIRNFYIEEIFTESQTTQHESVDYHPARYIHSEYDMRKSVFRHLDGAVHLYSHKDYFARRDQDLNFGDKVGRAIKPPSKKLFKYNRDITADHWINYCSHFCSGNPLIHEYFSGKLPERLIDAVEKLRKMSLTSR